MPTPMRQLLRQLFLPLLCAIAWSSNVAAATEPATVTLFNRAIVTFRSDLLGMSPQYRAQRTQERLTELLATPGEHVVSTHAIPQGAAIQINGKLIFVITPNDADSLTEETLDEAVEKAVNALTLVTAETQEGRDFHASGYSSLFALIATLLLLLIRHVLCAARNGLVHWLDKKVDLHLEKVQLAGTTILSREHTFAALTRIVNAIYFALCALLIYIWLGNVLGRFPFTRAWGEKLNTFLLDIVATIASGVASALPNLFVVLIIFFLTRTVANWSSAFFDRIGKQQTVVSWLDADLAAPTRRIVITLLWAFALVMAYPYFPGSHTEAFKGVSVLIGLMVSLGASTHIGQIVSGLILTYTHVFKHGEFVQVAGYEGTIIEIGLIATRMRTGMGEELYLPNSLVLGQVTKNYSRAVVGAGFIVDTTVTIGYDTPWRQVNAMLLEAANRTAGVVADPKPKVFQTSLSDFYPEYRLVCQAVPSEPRPRAEVMDALHANIQDVFNEYGVQIMSPHYFADPADAKLVPKDGWYPAPAKK